MTLRPLISVTLVLSLLSGLALAKPKPNTKASVPHKTTAGKAKSASPRAKPGAHAPVSRNSKYARSRNSRGRATVKSADSWRTRQAQPTPERYTQIQQALASKGYLKSAPSGTWDAESQDAMRRFQQDQKLEASGKLNSRSLIGLGLGPAPSVASSAPPAAPQPAPAK